MTVHIYKTLLYDSDSKKLHFPLVYSYENKSDCISPIQIHWNRLTCIWQCFMLVVVHITAVWKQNIRWVVLEGLMLYCIENNIQTLTDNKIKREIKTPFLKQPCQLVSTSKKLQLSSHWCSHMKVKVMWHVVSHTWNLKHFTNPHAHTQ